MSFGDQTNDWQVSGRLQVAAADGVGAGLFLFDFFSANLGVSALFSFKGAGVGIGGDASGGGVPTDIGQFGPWSSLDCDTPFSVWDLNGAWGRVTSASVGMGLLFGPVFITAAPPWSMFDTFFHSQNVGGFGFGGGAGAFVLVGNWRFLRVSNRTPSQSDDSDDSA